MPPPCPSLLERRICLRQGGDCTESETPSEPHGAKKPVRDQGVACTPGSTPRKHQLPCVAPFSPKQRRRAYFFFFFRVLIFGKCTTLYVGQIVNAPKIWYCLSQWFLFLYVHGGLKTNRLIPSRAPLEWTSDNLRLNFHILLSRVIWG